MLFISRLICLTFVLLVIVTTTALVNARQTEVDKNVSTNELEPVGKKLFDFQSYKKLFKKSYSGLVEELVRKKYFLSRAFRAFISAVKYKYRQASYYLAINRLSDATLNELDALRNRELEKAFGDHEHRNSMVDPDNLDEGDLKIKPMRGSESDQSLSSDDIDVVADLARFVRSKNLHGPGFDELNEVVGEVERRQGSHSRRKRSATNDLKTDLKLRSLPMERLINTGDDVFLDPEVAQKIEFKIESNNPNYQTLELQSFGQLNKKNRIQWKTVKKPPVETLLDMFKQILSKNSNQYVDRPFTTKNESDIEDDDQVYVDLRDTKCFFLPRAQGSCGSCYAFAMITMMEWLYCMRTGQLVAFSEQYMVDCGQSISYDLYGCRGGNPIDTAYFVDDFGLELRANYPYRMREDMCPYEEDIDLKSTGYIRSKLKSAVRIFGDAMGAVLKYGPLLVCISLGPGFYEYGGGVHGEGCNQYVPSHAVVLIGHGREDGQEYWLIRNSHSVGWGEGGYYKLSKDAGCIVPDIGFMYGTKDSVKFSLSLKKNPKYDEKIIKQHYANNMWLNDINQL